MDLRVLVADPEAIRRRLLLDVVLASEGLAAVGAVASLADSEAYQLIETCKPDIFLISGSLLELEPSRLALLDQSYPDTYFLVYDARPQLDILLQASGLKVRGFLSFNHLSGDEFRAALQIIAHGGAFIEPITARFLLDRLRSDAGGRVGGPMAEGVPELSSRENEVLTFVRRGLSNKEIALQMDISLGTVRAHLRNIFRKLDVSSRAGAASFQGPMERRRRLAG